VSASVGGCCSSPGGRLATDFEVLDSPVLLNLSHGVSTRIFKLCMGNLLKLWEQRYV
jgi:hypothetical protein